MNFMIGVAGSRKSGLAAMAVTETDSLSRKGCKGLPLDDQCQTPKTIMPIWRRLVGFIGTTLSRYRSLALGGYPTEHRIDGECRR